MNFEDLKTPELHSPESSLGRVQDRVDAFARGVRQVDDITMLAVTVDCRTAVV